MRQVPSSHTQVRAPDRRAPRPAAVDLVIRLVVIALAWGVSMAVLAGARLFANQRGFDAHVVTTLVIFFAGGTIGALTAFPTAVILVMRRPQKPARFAAMVLSLTIGTVGFTAFLFYLQFNRYYAAWHADPFTIDWMWQTVMTGGQAVYIFAVTGLPLFFPAGLALLFAAGMIFARTDGRRGAVSDRRRMPRQL